MSEAIEQKLGDVLEHLRHDFRSSITTIIGLASAFEYIAEDPTQDELDVLNRIQQLAVDQLEKSNGLYETIEEILSSTR